MILRPQLNIVLLTSILTLSSIHHIQGDIMDIQNKDQLSSTLRTSKIPVAVKFSTKRCPACVSYKPKFEALSENYGDIVKFIAVDIDDVKGVADEYGIRSIPTTILLPAGETKSDNQVVGADHKEVEKRIQQLHGQPKSKKIIAKPKRVPSRPAMEQQPAVEEAVEVEQAPNPNLIKDVDAIGFNSAIKGTQIVVAELSTTWCGYCKKMEPAVLQLAQKYSNIRFIRIDADKHPEIREKYSTTGFPTYLIFEPGKTMPKYTVRGANAELLANYVHGVSGQNKITIEPMGKETPKSQAMPKAKKAKAKPQKMKKIKREVVYVEDEDGQDQY